MKYYSPLNVRFIFHWVATVSLTYITWDTRVIYLHGSAQDITETVICNCLCNVYSLMKFSGDILRHNFTLDSLTLLHFYLNSL